MRSWLSVMLLLPLCALAKSSAQSPPSSDTPTRPLSVFVSVLPQKTFVERVGGNRVQVQAMVRPGDSPHTYDPTPRQVAALAEADLYVAVGGTFEDAWMDRIRATNPRMRILNSGEGLNLRAMNGEDDDDEGAHVEEHAKSEQATDPHLWTSPPLVKQMVERIRDTLSELDPAGAPIYTHNAAVFSAELDDLDRDIRAQLAGLTSRRFMVFHPAWGYFADTYDMTQVPIEREGKEPGPRALVALIDQARREQVKAIFVQPQFSQKAAAQIASAIGGRVEVINPLAADYIPNLRRVAAILAEAGRQ
jgi:zinc transport system substrate-binding protein